MLVRAFQLIRDCWWWCGSVQSPACCTPTTYIPMIHPQHCPLIGQPALLTVPSLVSPTCLVLFPGESGAAASLAATVFDSPCQTWAGLTDCCTLDCSAQTSSRRTIFPPLDPTGRICFHYSPLFPDLWSEQQDPI